MPLYTTNQDTALPERHFHYALRHKILAPFS